MVKILTKNKKTSLPHRNPAAIPARMRHAGPMKNNKDKRTNEGEDWSEEIEEYNMSKKIFTVNASTQIIVEAKDENEAAELAELIISKMLYVDFIYKINDQIIDGAISSSISVNESGAIVCGEQKKKSSFTRVLPLDMSKTIAEDILLKQSSTVTCFAEAVKNNALHQKEKEGAKKISEQNFDENEEASKCFKLPAHWDKISQLKEDKKEFDGILARRADLRDPVFAFDGRDYNKPIYGRKDKKAYIYHTLGEENTANEFTIFWNDDGAGDKDCCASLIEAIQTADRFIINVAVEGEN